MPRGKHEHWDEEMLARAAGMKRAGLPLTTIAERLGVSVGSARNRLTRIGAKRRLTGTSGRGPLPIGRIGLQMVETPRDTTDLLGTAEGREDDA